MGSSAYSSTSNTDYSRNISADLSSGDLSTGASKNMVAGGNINVDGLSEDLASQIFSVVQGAYSDAQNFVKQAIGTSDNRTQTTVETISTSLKEAYNSEQATISSFKTYALYATIGLIAWAYLKKG